MLSIFVSCIGDFNELVSLFEQLIGKKLSIISDDIGEKCNFVALDIEFNLLANHELDDDFDIKFSNYKAQINLIQLTSGDRIYNYKEMFTSIALYLAGKISEVFNTEAIVVRDLQFLIKEFNDIN